MDEFFRRAPDEVAPELLGWRLIHGGVGLRIVETEAYLGESDPASHAFCGLTKRNRSLFGEVGHAYVYRSYGIHLCFNVVAHLPQVAGAVLIRAGEVVTGGAIAEARRGRSTDLANGPGRLGQALGLTIADDGLFLLNDGELRLEPPLSPVLQDEISCGPRVGISKAVDWPLRFWLKHSSEVSRGAKLSRSAKAKSLKQSKGQSL